MSINTIKKVFSESIEVKKKVIDSNLHEIEKISLLCTESIKAGGKLVFCGNGGSAADAQHLAAELLVRLRSEINRRTLPALALALDTSSLTANGNDVGFESYYERMVTALCNKPDVLIAITTSSTSKNIIRALKAARAKNVSTVGFLGCGGGTAKELCDLAFIVPSNVTARIQESHITAGHAILEVVEDNLLAQGFITKEN